MLYVVTYNHHFNLYGLDFLKNSLATTVVAPSPSVADMLREALPLKDQTVTETIAHFIKGVFSKEDQERFLSKSKFYIFLSLIWKKLGLEPKYNEFDNLFNLFTELRSYTLDFNLISDIFSDEELPHKDLLATFWQFTEDAKIIDEQKAYQLFIDQDLSSIQNKNIIFWGFKHFSGLQIDLLKHLATVCDIYIPIPKAIYSGPKNQIDWPEWIMLGHTLIDIGDELHLHSQTQIITYSKNRLNQSLLKIPQADIFVVSDDFTLLNSVEIPWMKLMFKSNIEIFREDQEELFREFYNYIERNEPINFEALIQAAVKKQSFKKIKILSLCLELINVYTKHGENKLTSFDLKVLRYCIDLDLPRNFIIPLSAERERVIKTKEDFNFCEKQQNKIILFFEDMNSSKNHNALSDIQKKMKNISPIRNHKLDFLFFKHSLYDLTSEGKNFLLIPEDFLENNFDYSEVLQAIAQNNINDKIESLQKDKLDVLTVNQPLEIKANKKISYTYLQTFLECPRKFYYRYIDRLDLKLELSIELAPHEIGKLEHEIIGTYIKNGEKTYKQDVHLKIIETILNNFKIQSDKNIDPLNNQFYILELIENTKEVIIFLLSLALEIKFEEPIQQNGYTGSIDALFETGIIDFKRSEFSIPNKKEILEFGAIQLPFYLAHCNQDISVIGYLNIENISDSLFFVAENADEIIKNNLNKFNIKTYPLDFHEFKIKYSDFEKSLIERIQQEKKFIPNPKNPDACRYCDLKAVCYAKA
ncbi:MAG: PD-(D/E)XK nuclease family protein [Bacteriovoracaceae bacterium]